MKQILSLIFIGFLFSSTTGVAQDGDTLKQAVRKDNFLVGAVDRDELQLGNFGEHFLTEYKNYQPCTNSLQQIQDKIYNKSIVIVLATWCHDSQIQVGRFYKILDQLNYNTNNVVNICLDRDKLAGEEDIKKFDVTLVPTFIFYQGSSEKGRIIESPTMTLEKNIVQILN